MSAQSVLQVVVLRDGLLVGTQVFASGQFTVGSANGSDLHLDDARVQPLHARLFFQNGRVALQAAAGDAPVFVNGHRVQTCEVRPLDEVVCGPFVLKTRTVAQRPSDQLPPEVASVLGMAPPAPSRPAGGHPMRGQAVTVPAAQAPKFAEQSGVPISMRTEIAGVPLGVTTDPAIREAPTEEVRIPIPPTTQPSLSPQPLATGTLPSARFASTPPSATPASPSLAGGTQVGARFTPPVSGGTQALAGAPFGGAPVSGATQPSARFVGVAPEPDTSPSVRRVAPPASPGLRARDFAVLPEPGSSPRHARVKTPLPSSKVPAKASAPAKHGAPKARRAAVRTEEVKMKPGAPQLRLEVRWGDRPVEVRSFKLKRRTLTAGVGRHEHLPLWGFGLGENEPLADVTPQGASVHVPQGASAHVLQKGSWTPTGVKMLQVESLKPVLLTRGNISLLAQIVVPEVPAWRPHLPNVPWLLIAIFLLLSGGAGVFFSKLPDRSLSPDFNAKKLDPIAIRLMLPTPQKREKAKAYAKERLAAAKGPAKKSKKDVTRAPKTKQPKNPVAAASPALAALSKLTSAGGATNSLLAAADKASGKKGGSVNSAGSVLGALGTANGVGTAGVKLGGGFGGSTLGGALLRGDKGIGALGSRNVGKGKVGGTVTRATARTVAVKGSINREEVAKVVNANLQKVRACYERALIREPGLAGKVVLEWVIGSNGRVASAKTKSSTLKNPGVESCILRDLKGWKFPSPKGGSVIVSYPFLFNSVGY